MCLIVIIVIVFIQQGIMMDEKSIIPFMTAPNFLRTVLENYLDNLFWNMKKMKADPTSCRKLKTAGLED